MPYGQEDLHVTSRDYNNVSGGFAERGGQQLFEHGGFSNFQHILD